jgi:hypothetical protein
MNQANDDLSDDDYFALVAALSKQAAEEFRQALGDPAQQKLALCRYYKRGEQAGLTTGELIDFLGVSADCVLDKAGYDDEAGITVMDISANLTDEDIHRAILPEESA